jgi:hypothetical protein
VICKTCQSPYGGVIKDMESKVPTWRCERGHEQPYGDDEPPSLNERLITSNAELGMKLTDALVLLRRWRDECCLETIEGLLRETAEFLDEKHWRKHVEGKQA